ncbi:MAG: hypothetical protein EB168_10715 [Euryarchaeota archaeon]|nr:hypothetical protein [Euryarchaeota archaeon]
MPTFGADPDAPDKGWEERTPRTKRASNKVYELVKYFGYHRGMRMSQRFDHEDKSILSRHFSRRLSNGYSPEDLRSMVDRFYSSHYAASDYPALMFCKTEVQEELASEATIAVTDPVTQWLADGMPNDDSLFDSVSDVRKCVLLNCDDSVLRYPEVVADILREDYEPHVVTSMLTALESLIAWNLEQNDEDSGRLRDELGSISLPKELSSKVRSPKTLRRRCDTVREAVANVPSGKQKETW